MTTKPQLILIRGNAASGKSSLAQALQDHLGENTLLISQDMIRRSMLVAHDGPDSPAIPLLIHLLTYGHAHCPVTILEGILVADWYRLLWEKIDQLYTPNQVHAYYYDLTFEETCRRHLSRDKAKHFGEDALRRWWVDKDYLPRIKETVLTADLSLEDASQLILKDIS